MTILYLLGILGGVYLIIFGLRLLFQKGYVEKVRADFKYAPDEPFANRAGYMYDKYARGIGAVIVGLMLVAFAISSLLHP